MGIPYRHTDFKHFVWFFALVLGACVFSAHVKASDSLYTVENVTVDVTADNSVAARDQAFAKAQVDAFNILAQRMVEQGSSKKLSTPDVNTISAMIQDFEVTNEQVSAVRYIGTYTFRFRPSDVAGYFSVSGVEYTTTRNQPILVLPYFQENGRISIWSDTNIWMGAWGRANVKQGRVPLEVPLGDLMDVADLDDSRALGYDVGRLSGMLARYGTGEAVVVIAVPDSALAALTEDSAPASGALRISLYKTDNGTPQQVQDIAISADGQKTRAQVYDEAVAKVYELLQGDWKAKVQDVPSADSLLYQVSASFGSIREWVQIRKALSELPGLSGLSVLSLKPREARVGFSFRGDENYLRQTLGQGGLDLGEPVGGVYTLGYNPVSAEPEPIVQHQTDTNAPQVVPQAGEPQSEQQPPEQQPPERRVHTF